MVGSLQPAQDGTKDMANGQTNGQAIVGAQMTEEVEEVPAICCLQGCLTACTVAGLFFIVLPAGILVTVYSSNNNDPELMAAGIVLMALPIVALPIVTALVLNRRRLQKMRKTKISSTPERKPENRQRY